MCAWPSIGTRGVPHPDSYSGFETCLEQVGLRMVERGHKVVLAVASLTAKPTAILSDLGNRQQTSADSDFLILILRGHHWTLADANNAVFKTVCGALLRRPG